MYLQDTKYDYNNSNQLPNYQLCYSLFTNVHYGQPTDLMKTCKTQCVHCPETTKSLFLSFMFYEKGIKTTEIKQSDLTY